MARYQDRVFGLLLRMCGSATEAEDLAQETFLKVYRSLSGFRHGSQFYTWLFRIAVNVAYTRRQQAQRRQKREGASLDSSQSGEEAPARQVAAPASSRPEAELEKKRIQARVQAALLELKEEYRAIILLKDMDGLDYDRIAETLDITRAAVKSRLHRARQELAVLLKDLNDGGM